MYRDAVDWARGVVLARGPSGLSPEAVLFLLRDFIVSGNDQVRDAVERGLTAALTSASPEADPCIQLQWLRVLTEATVFSDDERLRDTVTRTLPASIDALERVIRRSYEPGDGLLDTDCAGHLRWSAALLAAFDLSGRVPYAMLADELLHHARRHWWREAAGLYDVDFAGNCEALHVLCRLAGLHADAEYRAAAVVAPMSSCASDARRLVDGLVHLSRQHPAEAAAFGSALLDWFALEPNLQ